MAFRCQIPIRFGDEDHAGLVYFPRFFDYFHRAFEDFFAAHGHPYKDVLDVDRAGWPAVHSEADFSLPVRFGDVLDLEVTLARIGRSSATFVYRGRLKDKDAVLGKVTVACVNLDTFTSQPIPDKYRKIFEQHLVE